MVAEIGLAVTGPPGIGFGGKYKNRFKRVTACIHKSVAYEITGAVRSCEQKCLEIADE